MFCKTCGSPVWSERLDKPDVVRLRVGLINEEISTPVMSHAFVNSQVKGIQFVIRLASTQMASKTLKYEGLKVFYSFVKKREQH